MLRDKTTEEIMNYLRRTKPAPGQVVSRTTQQKRIDAMNELTRRDLVLANAR